MKALVALCMLHACTGGRDVESPLPPPARDAGRRVAEVPSDAGDSGYEQLLTRPHATFGLAEARGIEPERLAQTLGAIANGFETCAAGAQREGWLDRAALRLVVEIDAHGTVLAVDPKLDDPTHGGKVTLLCLVAPIKALNFGERAGNARRGLALEVLFAPVRAAP